MQPNESPLPPLPGTRHFFTPRLLHTPGLSIRGLGVRELMSPCIIERSRGTEDYLFMLFHDPAMMAVNRSDMEMQPQDTMMIWPPGKAQYYGNARAAFRHSWIHCEGTRVKRMLKEAGVPVGRPFEVHSPLFQQAVMDIHGQLVSYAFPDDVIIGNLLENALRELARKVASGAGAIRIPENLLAVRRLIGTAPARGISLQEMAAMAGMSVPYFCSRFKKVFGVTPVRCLVQQHMHHATRLLADKTLNIGEVARETGYEDVFHFSRTFKRHHGLSPLAYRRKHC